jgi:uncharacterized membrane protein YheB (UPF0754 family)
MLFSAAELLILGGPPLIGAFIGYLTNKVAVKMLFRPLKPWHVFGLRVPLTPGVIPSKRHELAENIGAMVGGQLLTPQDIGEALSSERFQDHLRRIISNRVQDLLSRDLGPLLNLVPQRFRVHARIGLRAFKHRLRSDVLAYLGSPAFAEAVSSLLHEQLDSRSLNALLQAEERQGLYALLDTLLEKLLHEPHAAEQLGGWLEQSLTEAAVAGKTLADFFPVELRQQLGAAAVEQTPQVLAHAAVILAEPPVRARIVEALKNGAEHFIDSLGPMAAMAKGFINIESLDDIIHKWLAEREDDLAAWLRQPDIQERTAQALSQQAEAFFTTRLADLLGKIEPEQQQQLCQQAATRLLAFLAEEKTRQALSAALQEQIEELLEQGDISLAALADKVLPAGRQKLEQVLVKELRALAESEPLHQLIGKLINRLLDQLTNQPAGMLHDLLSADLRSGITDYLVLTANRLLIREVPDLTESLRIQELVRNKVDSLDLLRLERLLLSIMEEQFKYINLFGALLGFLIGLLNLLLMRLA